MPKCDFNKVEIEAEAYLASCQTSTVPCLIIIFFVGGGGLPLAP